MLLRLCAEQKSVYALLSTTLYLWQGHAQRQTYNSHCQSKFDVRAEKNTGPELAFGDEGMSPTCVLNNLKVPCAH